MSSYLSVSTFCTPLLKPETKHKKTAFCLSSGEDDDGDIFKENNLVAFRKFIMESTDNKGVHFMMADGVCAKNYLSVFVVGVSVCTSVQQARKQASRQAGKQASRQAGKQAGRRAGEQAGRRAGKQVSRRAGK